MGDEQHKADLDRAHQLNSATDLVRGLDDGPMSRLFNGAIGQALRSTKFGRSVSDRTDFGAKDLDLNAMLDMVELTDPEDLESSGKALWDARDAIKKAADELKGRIGTVSWTGKAGDNFHTWGKSLVENTYHLSDYAGAAGDQITAAATGLASVRGGMPSRDTRAVQKRPEAFSEAEKAENKEGYTAALKVEKDRQEAINQMNRLASYYAVSEDTMGALPRKQPVFEPMKDVGVPRPEPRAAEAASGRTSGSGDAQRSGPAAAGDLTRGGGSSDQVGGPGRSEVPPPRIDVADPPVRTNIDSVDAPPAPSPAPTTNSPSATGTPGPQGGQTAPFGGGYQPPMSNGMSKTTGPAGTRGPLTAQGRAGMPAMGNSTPGRAVGRGPTGQMGPVGAPGQAAGKGSPAGSRSLPMGQGISGGTARATGANTPRVNGGSTTGAGRANGVVGGRPTTAGGTPAKGAARIPRGTVVGNEGAANSRPTAGRPGQRGVFGAPGTAAQPGANAATSRAAAGKPEAVTGRSTARNSAARAERNGMTRGGAGLVRGPGGRGRPDEARNEDGSQRPDYLVEDEETHRPTQPRRDVPPVIN
ncbi:hypothetical protein GCM10010234_35430 [Streptomyces hawaiiensis]|uniref:hypothetical protein n=1 Tax=Streptomyces hawaiiensis TaxID=67305 RepID=UPI0031D57669